MTKRCAKCPRPVEAERYEFCHSCWWDQDPRNMVTLSTGRQMGKTECAKQAINALLGISFLGSQSNVTNDKVLIKDKLQSIRHSQVISDPFPEHSAQSAVDELARSVGLLGLKTKNPDPKPISIWEAYKMGYDKAYAEIIAAIGNKELK